MRHVIIFFLVATAISSCSSSPQDLILGEWKYDRIETTRNGLGPTDARSQQIFAGMYGNTRFVFREDGKCEVYSDRMDTPTVGDYSLVEDGKTLVTNHGQSNDVDSTPIIKLTESELWMDLKDGSALVFIKK